MDFLLLAASLALLLIAAHYFVEGISAIAADLGVSPLVIGMTVVAFGTSTPELVVNVLSAQQRSTALAFGNIIGSSIINLGLVLGITALVRPMKVEPSVITREIPMMLVAVAAAFVMANDEWLDQAAANTWSRTDGFVLLLFFSIFLYYTTRAAMSARRGDTFLHVAAERGKRFVAAKMGRQLLMTIGGLAGVSLGADWTVERAVSLARQWGVSETVIGLTIISVGTTLPEMATSIVSARRGHAEIALGNVVGSNLFNLLCVAGLVAVVHPVAIPKAGIYDLCFLAYMAVISLPIAISSGRTITRQEGGVLVSSLVAYLLWRFVSGLSAA
ncbi:MAG: calcium/sodium antiporter [Bryobacter sp.]